MSVRKESPPEEEKPRKPVTKTKPTARKTPAAKKPATKKAPTKAAPKKATTKKTTPNTPAAKNDDPQADQKKPRPRSPINGAELPEGRPFEQGEEQRERARRAGKKSGEVRRARKTFREEMLELLQVTSPDSDGKPHTQQELILAAMIKEARGGNVKAYEAVQSTIGEKQQERLEVAVALPQFDTLDAAFSGLDGDAQ